MRVAKSLVGNDTKMADKAEFVRSMEKELEISMLPELRVWRSQRSCSTLSVQVDDISRFVESIV